ncbi:NUDIX hydrolase [Gracilibacillus phocaeensis]|uniref:NUDIX hydrolase n=1 Tax=Gracilibacillus phocaeensis TaxID=2042304 RepID=UPI00102F3F6A|nr:NUDIX hydrolase [Gracilibacillus phocaeensis]
MKRIDVVYVLLRKGNEILMVYNHGGDWSLPGGAVEQGETLEQAAIREVKEETGLTVRVEKIAAVNEAVFMEKGHHAIFFTFTAKIIDGIPLIQDEEEISEIRWVDVQTANKFMPYHPDGVESLLEASSPYTFQG